MPKPTGESATLDPPTSPGGSFYDNPEHDMGDQLSALFGGAPEGDDEPLLDDDLEEVDPHTDPQPGDTPPAAPKPSKPKEKEETGEPSGSALEEQVARLVEQNARLMEALLAQSQPAPAAEPAPEEKLEEPEPLDDETMRMFQLGDPDATKRFQAWVRDLAYYQSKRGLADTLPRRVEAVLNTQQKEHADLTKRTETWYEKNAARVKAIRDGAPFTAAVTQLEGSGKLSPKYIEIQLDRILEHVEAQAKLYGVEATPNGATPPKSTPRGAVPKGFRPTTGGASRRAPEQGAQDPKAAVGSVDDLLGNRPMFGVGL